MAEPRETPHDRWVRLGNCPAVSLGRSWCIRRAGHSERAHASPLAMPDGSVRVVEWER